MKRHTKLTIYFTNGTYRSFDEVEKFYKIENRDKSLFITGKDSAFNYEYNIPKSSILYTEKEYYDNVLED